MNWVALVVLAGLTSPEGAVTTGVAMNARGETQSAELVTHGRLHVGFELSRFFVRANGSVLLSGSSTVMAHDLGSSLTVGVRPSQTVRAVSLEFIPLNPVNRRAFFDWDNRVGVVRSPTSAMTLQFELQKVTAWLTGRLAHVTVADEIPAAVYGRPVPDFLAGLDVTLFDGFDVSFRAAWQTPSFLLPYNKGSQFISSARVSYTWRHAVAPIADFVNYGDDPQRFERFFTQPSNGTALQVSLEGGFVGGWRSIAPGARVTAAPGGWLDLQARLQVGNVRVSATGRLQTFDFLAGSSRLPHVVDFLAKHMRVLGLLGAAYRFERSGLTPGVLAGVSVPSVLVPPRIDPSGSNPPPGLDIPRHFAIDRDGYGSYPADLGTPVEVHLGGSLTWQPTRNVSLVATADVTTQRSVINVVDRVLDTRPRVRAQVLAQFAF